MSGKFMMNGIEYLGGGSGGGGGNVDDVYVNGTSVLDEDKIAQITSYKEVTQSEYNALPATKETDGIAYFIKDSTEAEGFPPLIYSFHERQVGVWTDGKPLYQKTIDVGLLPSDTNWHQVAHNIENIDHVVSAEGILLGVSDNQDIPVPGSRPGQTAATVFFRTGANIEYMNNWLSSNSKRLYATIRYTKTTDTAGQGIWAGNGSMAHHYSTDEVIVGTWIDGKPLYERAFSKMLSGSPDSGNDSFIIAENITYIDTLVNMSGTVKNSNLYAFCSETGLIPTNGWNYSFHIKTNGQLVVWTSNNSSYYGEITGGKAVAILQYTKTTD